MLIKYVKNSKCSIKYIPLQKPYWALHYSKRFILIRKWIVHFN